MKVEIDERSGFCFGVVNAITRAEEALGVEGKVYCLGDIVHNRMEVLRLGGRGLETIGHEDIKNLSGRTVLIRAHGEPPSTYRLAEKSGIRLIDATCPVVERLQKKVVEAHRIMRDRGGQVILLGQKGHAEVIGLTGQVPDKTIVIEDVEDLCAIDFGRPVYLLSQTTKSLELFREISEIILSRVSDKESVIIDDTICRQVSNRTPHLEEFALGHDVVIFVSGRKSSNGKALFRAVSQANPRSYNIEDESELRAEWFEDCALAGVCGATSTPKWLMEQVAEAVRRMDKE